MIEMLRSAFDCLFVSHSAPAFLTNELDRMTIELRTVPLINYSLPDKRKQGEEVPYDMAGIVAAGDIVVLDGYWFGESFQKAVKGAGAKLVCVDDLHDQHFFADLIINHSPGVKQSDYSAERYSQFALGANYAILRPGFLQQASVSRPAKNIESLFICFGGSDSRNLTTFVLEKAIKFSEFRKIIVVAGPSNPFVPEIRLLASRDERVQVFSSVDERQMIALMLQSDLAIVPASNMVMECLATGLQVIAGVYAANQQKIFEGYLQMGVITGADNFESDNLERAIRTALSSKNETPRVFDGLSGRRLLQKIGQLDITIRPVNGNDCELLFVWANDPDVRKNAIRPSAIPWEDHKQWFANKLGSPASRMFIMERQNIALGQIRYDLKDGCWSIDYAIDKQYRGEGLGKKILELTLPFFAGEIVRATVKASNPASKKAFEAAGFAKTGEQEMMGEIFVNYQL